MPTLDEAAPGMRKLTRGPVPVKVLRNPFQLAQARAELERFRKAKSIRLEGGLLAFLGFRRDPSDAVIQTQIKALELREAQLSGEFLEGMLVPLTEAEVWECRVEFGAILNTLKKREIEYEGEAKAAVKAQIEDATGQIWIAKWVEAALKKAEQVNGAWVRALGSGELALLDPPAMQFIFNRYHESFTLSEDELKKSVAPTTAGS